MTATRTTATRSPVGAAHGMRGSDQVHAPQRILAVPVASRVANHAEELPDRGDVLDELDQQSTAPPLVTAQTLLVGCAMENWT